MSNQFLPRDLCIMNGFWVGTSLTTQQLNALIIDEIDLMCADTMRMTGDEIVCVRATPQSDAAYAWDATITTSERLYYEGWLSTNIDAGRPCRL